MRNFFITLVASTAIISNAAASDKIYVKFDLNKNYNSGHKVLFLNDNKPSASLDYGLGYKMGDYRFDFTIGKNRFNHGINSDKYDFTNKDLILSTKTFDSLINGKELEEQDYINKFKAYIKHINSDEADHDSQIIANILNDYILKIKLYKVDVKKYMINTYYDFYKYNSLNFFCNIGAGFSKISPKFGIDDIELSLKKLANIKGKSEDDKGLAHKMYEESQNRNSFAFNLGLGMTYNIAKSLDLDISSSYYNYGKFRYMATNANITLSGAKVSAAIRYSF